ncbi:type II secretion system protein N [Roseateles violae]|uniref:Type II secretion system protein N n=1 Tax=Roseateles violae TaxID=3058042 RepID=A0ABT8DW83_9BURK|nr:type II secretion system protein N [Pelomonas sp. PFR6]MDN3921154.1 type II secretion system protein N [Pelomonas sp. PFR6]
MRSPFGRSTAAAAAPREAEPQRAPRRWAIAGAALGGLAALLAFAPASWLAQGVARASEGHLLITETRGSLWNGSGVLVLAGGAGARDASALPGRLHWTVQLQGLGLGLIARQDCCINGELRLALKPGLGRFEIAVANGADWLARWPAGWLAGLGTPFNTLQPAGSLRLAARDFRLERVEGRWRQFGQLELDLLNLSSRVSTVAPLGSYRLSVAADPGGAGSSRLSLSTLDGALLLSGQGSIGGVGGKARFAGEATAAPGREAALDNLLNIIGRRQGARSVISIG